MSAPLRKLRQVPNYLLKWWAAIIWWETSIFYKIEQSRWPFIFFATNTGYMKGRERYFDSNPIFDVTTEGEFCDSRELSPSPQVLFCVGNLSPSVFSTFLTAWTPMIKWKFMALFGQFFKCSGVRWTEPIHANHQKYINIIISSHLISSSITKAW